MEDAISVRAERQFNGFWIPVDRQALNRDEQGVPANPKRSNTDWHTGSSVQAHGVCRIKQARIRFFAPNRYPHGGHLDRRGVVFTRHSRRVAYPHAPRILQRQIREIASRGSFIPRANTHLPGRAALLGNAVPDASNYYHFWIDSIGDLLFLQKVLPMELQPDYWLMSHAGQPWQYEIMDMLGIDHDRVIPFSDHSHIVADELLVPVRDKRLEHLMPGLVECIRGASPVPTRHESSRRALYITRNDSRRRPVQNETAVQDLVLHHGFEVRSLSGMSVADQIELFASADIVVATHGAGLTNLMWCQPGTTVIELLPNRHQFPCFYNISRQRSLHHQIIHCSQPGTERGLTAPMSVPLEPLEIALEQHRTA
ncbi:DUF563 domain-containing protein [Thioalkalivibrio sp. ALJ9]|uniref:glycosyltransferase family 61 protein n=1 Tax=Thioalkalivibrio sp. ALJ9 TaxID=1158758 RepID=UPI0009DAFC14|nr:glycosyltransferase family 61 protein [Thioalkalivibrio sp. ALJ9]